VDAIRAPALDDADIGNLTELERAALRRGINVADGHARFEPTGSQQKILSRLPELFAAAAEESEVDLDREAQVAFLSALGQHTATTGAELLTCYSSSVAMEIFGRSLAMTGARRVALIHPTFDNIPDVLKGNGLRLHPVREDDLHDGSADLPPDIEVLFITTPNNPTGRVLRPDLLRHWAETCALRGIVLALDTSFRGFDVGAQYDHYAVLAEAGCRYVVIEDTGKLWPTLDLKVGILAFPATEPLPLRRTYTDLLLGVSPLILALVRHFAEDAASGGFAELYRLVARNRLVVGAQLGDVSTVWFPDPDSRISVLRIGLPPDRPATRMWRDLRAQGVHVLPCRQFFWADPRAGERFVRVAIGRPTELVADAAAAIRRCCEAA
jgi:enduracididine biosynthesis enzyme MppP